MRIVKALYDGNAVQVIEPVKIKKNMQVFVIIPDDTQKISQDEARRHLRGSAKGERLTEKLLKSRNEDLKFEQRE
ncbi:MAG: hypothetical protein GY749_17950 [Desulfobacteraceae bacterium]|nr:hypothetical protein [Desulfobacteraceae bacterium]